jgi:hypothetical protein
MESLNIDKIKFNKLENSYNKDIETICLFFIYINKYNEVYSIKSNNEILNNSCLSEERILYLIKNNQYNLLNKHKLVSLLQFNIDLEETDLKNFILDQIKSNYLKSLKILDTIKFTNNIKCLQNLNSVIFLYTNISSGPPNNTKKIMLKPKNSKTRRKKDENENDLKYII